MKNTIRFSFSLLLAWFVSLVAVQTAQASVTTDHSGTICHAYNAGQATSIDYLANGARVLGAYSLPVICPIVRSTNNSAGATFDIDVTHSGTQTTSCTVYSYSYTGTYLGSAYASWNGAGQHEFSLTIPNGQSNYWSTYAVLCYLPASATGVLNDIDVIEY
jgi:hypothetical protein